MSTGLEKENLELKAVEKLIKNISTLLRCLGNLLIKNEEYVESCDPLRLEIYNIKRVNEQTAENIQINYQKTQS